MDRCPRFLGIVGSECVGWHKGGGSGLQQSQEQGDTLEQRPKPPNLWSRFRDETLKRGSPTS